MKLKKWKPVLGILVILVCWWTSCMLTVYAPEWVGTQPMMEFEARNWLRFAVFVGGEILLGVISLCVCTVLHKMHDREKTTQDENRMNKTRFTWIVTTIMATEWIGALGVVCAVFWKLPAAVMDGVLCVAVVLLVVLVPQNWSLKEHWKTIGKPHCAAAMVYAIVLCLGSMAMMWSVIGLLVDLNAWFLRMVCMLTYVGGVFVVTMAWMNMVEALQQPDLEPETKE
ncbi:MAG: hypothetical protein IJY28_02585 [Clostridia bacterium]|nr:hypothetical protein [Clostridia bacterium]